MDIGSTVFPEQHSEVVFQHKCPACPYSSTSEAGLVCHLTAKHSERLVAVCKICQQVFTSDAIGPHVLVCKGSHSCPYCRATFALSSYLQRHISRCHQPLEQRPSCEICKKKFSSANALAVHRRIHQDHFPYTCHLCSAKFAQNNHLKLHLDSHHAYVEMDGAPKPFVCKTCGRGFLYITSLQQHLLQHSKISPKKLLSCKVCKKTFAYQSELQRHSVVHSKCSPYQCSLCSRSFTRVNLLKTHMLLHTDPSFLTCCYCSRKYASRSYLLKHIEKHEEKIQTPSISSLSTTSVSELELNTLDECEGNISKIGEIWDESTLTNFSGDQVISPDVSFLHAFLYRQKSC